MHEAKTDSSKRRIRQIDNRSWRFQQPSFNSNRKCTLNKAIEDLTLSTNLP